ncbi:hypothetical protein ACROYT_G009011 [Oculina patagonica]
MRKINTFCPLVEKKVTFSFASFTSCQPARRKHFIQDFNFDTGVSCIKMKKTSAVKSQRIEELQDHLDCYKTHVERLRKEDEAQAKLLQEMTDEIRQLREEKESLSNQLKLTMTVVDSEELVKSNGKEQISDLQKEKTMMELKKGTQINQLEELNQQLTDNSDDETSQKDELNAKIKSLQEELKRLRQQLDYEKSLKTHATNKLTEIMLRTDPIERDLDQNLEDRSHCVIL